VDHVGIIVMNKDNLLPAQLSGIYR